MPESGPDAGAPAPYDFARPRLLTQDAARALRAVHERFARAFGAHLSSRLHALVTLRVTGIEEATAAAFAAHTPRPAALYALSAAGDAARADAPFALGLDPRLALYLAERLLGGAGTIAADARALTPLEQRVTQRHLAERALHTLEEAWEPAGALHARVEQFVADPALLDLGPSEGALAVVRARLEVEGFAADLALVYPALFVARALTASGRGAVSAPASEAPQDERERFEETVGATTVELRVELGRARLPLADLLGLQEGDVIPLDRRAHEPLAVYVGAHERFRAAAGRAGRRAALRILTVLPPSS